MRSYVVLILIFGILTVSCAIVNEDLELCAPKPNTITTVNFVYDYNSQKKDLFSEHVGSVYLYVFDEEGFFKVRKESHKANMGNKIDFSIKLNTMDIKPGRTYQFVAVAQGNYSGYVASLGSPGFTLQSEMIPEVSKIEDYILKLDRNDDGEYDFGVVDFRNEYGNNEAMIDTIWTTKPDETQIVNIPFTEYEPSLNPLPDNKFDVTIPMMRITNSVKVLLISPGVSQNTSPDDYNILINFPNGNGTIDFMGQTFPAQELYYRALRKSLVNISTRGDEEMNNDTFAIKADFGLSRLQVADGSSLQIRDAATNEIIAKIDDFSEFLAEYFEHGFDSDQEFLDREYDFEIEIHLDEDDRLIGAVITIEPLGWSVKVNLISIK